MLSIAARPASSREPSCHPSSWLRYWPALLACFWIGVAAGPASAQPANGLLREVFEGIGGVAVTDLVNAPSYPNSPTTTGYVADFEAPTDVLEEYGQRLRGYLVPPVSGNYTFWIASDDGGELWLSTDDTPERRTRIASVAGWTSPREWSREAGQQSASISLSAGQIYYVEALMKEGGGGDNLAVRWRRPDGVDQGPIPATHLLPWGVALRAPEITRQPVATQAIEGSLASFDVQTHPLGPARFQWRRNGQNLPNATGRVLDFGPVSFADQGARFSVALTNTFGGVISTNAVLTVLPDTNRPALLRVENRAATSVRVVFSEPMAPDPAQTPGNYLLNQGATVSAATLDANGRTVTLTVSPLTFGVTYTLSVAGVTDQAATPNLIAAGTQRAFLALEYTPTDIGWPSQTGQVVRRGPGRFDVTGGGEDIGANHDQFQFASELRTGNFDVQTRVEDVIVSSPFLHAGLMARFSMASNAPFAAVFASSAQLGCFFESRSSASATSATSAPRNGFPVSYPDTWLRLRRVGNTFTGFASVDGVEWNVLGSEVLGNAPNTLFFGLAVASQNPAETTTARFREVGPTTSTRETTLHVNREPLGPFVRSTGLVLSECHYHPADDPSGRDFEFLELYNAGSVPEDLSGARLSGEIEYTFPEGTRLQAGAFLVVAANPADVASGYGIQGVLGPYAGRLSNGGGDLELLAREGDRLFAVSYASGYPWPVAADGAGPSLVLSRPSYGPEDPRAWSSSQYRGGSPGRPEPVAQTPLAALQINEILAHTDDPERDFVELFNSGSVELDLSGCILTDNASTNRFVIPSGTRLAPRTQVSFDQDQLGFALNSAGETVYLIQPDGRRVLDAVRFGPQENGVSLGRQPDGSPVVRRLEQPTPGVANASWRRESVVISELMYHPISEEDAHEYLELQNRTDLPIPLGGWEFTDGIDFRIPAGVTLPAAGRLVIAKDPARLRSAHPALPAHTVLGPFSGSLSDRGERVALGRPDELHRTNALGVVVTTRVLVDVAEVTYRDGGAWPEWADGGGSSLELTDLNSDPWLGANWADSDESAKGEWTTVSTTGRLDNGIQDFPPDQLQVTLQGGGEALVDDVEVLKSGSTVNLVANPGFEASSTLSGSNWTLQGNHATSTLQTGGAASGDRCLSIRTQGRGDTGFNRIRTPLAPGLADGDTATLRAKVRWVRGWPEVLFRIRGNWLELPAALSVPRNLGTPGAPNSRRVENAGPAISEVTHTPPLPAANEPVVVTARVSDPDGVGTVRLIGRVDGSATSVHLTLRDDGASGDAFAGDGIYSATLIGRSGGTLIAFRIEATDGATEPASTRFPPEAPSRECLVRWGDAVPFGTLGHYHLWSTAATESARNASSALNNLYRDATFVYGHSRVIYGAGFKDKGSPFKGGAGDWYVILPKDQPLLNTDELAIVSTGNNGSDGTQLREQLCFTIARDIGAAYLHRRFVRLYRNGSLFRDIMEDSEEPNGDYAERFFRQGDRPDLYKIEDWFEFQNDGTSFINVDATLQRFTSPPGQTGAPLKPARYRWNWRKRAVEASANNFTNLLDLVTAVNTRGTSYLPRVFATVDVDQWMRTFAFQRIVGNWDSYGMGRGKNMYAYKRDGMTWKLFSWDVDFALDSGGNGPGDGLWGAGDPTINTLFETPAIQRRLWQAYRDAVLGPMDPARAAVEAAARAVALRNNGVPSAPHLGALDYIAARRQTIVNAYAAADVPTLEITSNGGNTLTTSGTTITLTGRAPLGLTDLTVNGVPFPATWSDVTTWRLVLPLSQATNDLTLAGVDRFGRPIPGVSDSLRIITSGVLPQAADFVVINEIQHDPAAPGASFLELHNRSTSTPFDLSGHRLEGIAYSFPTGALIPADGFLVLARNRAGFNAAYGSGIPVFDEFPGNLDNDGERLALVRPDPTGGTNDFILDEVRYGIRFPWPTNTAGFGPSLQLLDPALDNRRPGAWASTAIQAPNQATPGAVNAGRTTLPSFPAVWINEVLPSNTSGPADNLGEREPYVELVNSGSASADLSTFFLTDRESNLTRWAFPPGTSIEPGGFLRLWADGEPAESAPGHLHLGFRIAPTSGVVALVRLQGPANAPAVMDALDYSVSTPNRSTGSFPDGDPLRRRLFENPSPGAPNDPSISEIPVAINEWMSSNASALADPADGNFDDWFELHNRGTTPVDLSGYFLTDNLAQWNQSRIPPGFVIPPGGFLLVWADSEPGQNAVGGGGDLHVGFRLSAAGEQLGLFDPNGRMVDGVEFGPLADNAVLGRYPDGAMGSLLLLDQPSPRAPNVLAGGNVPPALDSLVHRSIPEGSLLQFTVTATDPDPTQRLTFSLDPGTPTGAAMDSQTGVFTWTPSEAQGPGIYVVGIRVTDDGVPPRSDVEPVTLTVTEVNLRPTLLAPAPVTIDEGSLLSLTLQATDPDLPAQTLSFSLVNPPAGAEVDADSGVLSWTPSESQGPGVHPVRIRVTDDGEPPLSAEQTFQVTVLETDAAPVLLPLPPVILREGETLTVTHRATDSDSPPAVLRFSLPAGAPNGVSLDPVTGVLHWATTEDDGPGSHLILIRVTQQGASPLSDQDTFGVTILEENQAPTLSPIANVVVEEGDRVTFVASASDADRPAQSLTFSLAPGAPPGAQVDPVTGHFSWQTDPDAGAGDYTLVMRVRDDGPDNLEAEQLFRVTIQPRFQVVISELMSHPPTLNAEYIELLNRSQRTPWSLAGLQLEGGSLRYTFPANATLAPGASLCVVRHLAAFRSAYGDTPAVAGSWTGTLDPAGDRLRLILPSIEGETEVVLDEFRFEAAAPWPAAVRGDGASLQLVDARRDNTRPGNWSQATAFTGSMNLVRMTNEWRYYQNGPLPASWITPDFPHATWPVGRGLLYVETSDLPEPKSTPLTLGQNTYYFRTTFVLPSVPAGAQLILHTVLDDGAVFYLNGREWFRQNIPPEVAVDFNTAASLVDNAVRTGPFTLPAAELVAGTNVLAVEVHQVNTGSSDIVFGCSLVMEGGQVALFTPGFANNTTSELPEFPPVWINEVLPLNTTGITDADGNRKPWIELVNRGDDPVPLAGWYLSPNAETWNGWRFPDAAVLPPRSLVVLFANGQPEQSTPTEWHADFQLDPSAGIVVLSRPQNGALAVVDYLRYTGLAPDISAVPSPEGPAGSSQSSSPTPGTDPILDTASLAIRSEAGRIELLIGTLPGRIHRLESTPSLDSGEWVLEQEIPGTGNPVMVPLSDISLSENRYFRVVVP